MDAIHDTSMSRLTKSINAIGEAFEEFKKTNDERIEALAGGKDSRAAELDQKLLKLEKAIAAETDLKKRIEIEQTFMRERVEELESRAHQPGRTMAEKRQSEYKTTFMEWVRNKGQSPLHEQQLQNIVRSMVEAKDVTIASGPGGGFAVPEESRRWLDARADLRSLPVRGSYLDVGCGRGEMLRAAEEFGFWRVRGAEIVPELIEGARVVRAEVHDLPFADHSFDVASMFDVIEHLVLGDDERACRELSRVARSFVLVTANNHPSFNAEGDDLHINKRPYEHWDFLFRQWFPGEVIWIKRGNPFSETWKVDLR